MVDLKPMSKAIIAVAVFISVTLALYLLQEAGIIPSLIFMIGFGLTILICALILVYPDDKEWRNATLIPRKRK